MIAPTIPKRMRPDEEISLSPEEIGEDASLACLETVARDFFSFMEKQTHAECPHASLKKRIAFLKEEIGKMKAMEPKIQTASIGARPLIEKIPPQGFMQNRFELEIDQLILNAATEGAGSSLHESYHLKQFMKQWPLFKTSVSQPYHDLYECFSSVLFHSIRTEFLLSSKPSFPYCTFFRILRNTRSEIDGKEAFIFDPLLTACIACHLKNPLFPLLKKCWQIYLVQGHRYALMLAPNPLMGDALRLYSVDFSILNAMHQKGSLPIAVCNQKPACLTSADLWFLSSHDFPHFSHKECGEIQKIGFEIIEATLIALCRPPVPSYLIPVKAKLQAFTQLGIANDLTLELQQVMQIAEALDKEHATFQIDCSFFPLKRLCEVMLHSKMLKSHPPRFLFYKGVANYVCRSSVPEPLRTVLMVSSDPEEFWTACQRIPIHATLKNSGTQKLTFSLNEFISQYLPLN